MEKIGAQQPPKATAGAEAAALQAQILGAKDRMGDEKGSGVSGAKTVEKTEGGLGSYFVSGLLVDLRWEADGWMLARLCIWDEG